MCNCREDLNQIVVVGDAELGVAIPQPRFDSVVRRDDNQTYPYPLWPFPDKEALDKGEETTGFRWMLTMDVRHSQVNWMEVVVLYRGCRFLV